MNIKLIIVRLLIFISIFCSILSASETSGVFNVRDFIDAAGGDVTTGIKEAISQANLQGGGGKTVFFPHGSYKITSTVEIAGPGIQLIGESSIGQGTEITWDATVTNKDQYLFCVSNYQESFITIKNIQFIAPYSLDLRNHTSKPSSVYVERCTFKNQECDYGIALNFAGHDFSVFKECSFASYGGYCAIKGTGNSVVMLSSTQIKILDCNLGGSAKIGISLEYIQSSIIRGNDFSGHSLSSIDIGGKIFKDNLNCDENLAYIGGLSKYQKWIGWFKNITIENNHFEWYKHGVYADGRTIIGNEGAGLYLINNNFLHDGRNHEKTYMYKIKHVIGIRSENNSMNYWRGGIPNGELQTTQRQYGIYTIECKNASFENDIFYSEADDNLQTFLANNYSTTISPPWAIYHYDEGNHTRANIIRGNSGGIFNTGSLKPHQEIKYSKSIIMLEDTSNISLSNHSNIKSTIPAVGFNKSLDLSFKKTISNSAYGQVVLMENVPARTCGTLYLSILIAGCSNFLTVRHISFVNMGGLVITKASGESDGNYYDIVYENGNVILKPLLQFANSHCMVNGYFTGMSENNQ